MSYKQIIILFGVILSHRHCNINFASDDRGGVMSDMYDVSTLSESGPGMSIWKM